MPPLTEDEQCQVDEAFAEAHPQIETESERRQRARRREDQDARRRAEAALRRAAQAARKGDAAAAKHWTDIAQRLTQTAERLAALPPLEPPAEEAERLRAEIRERFRRLREDDMALERWLIRREIWEEIAEQAKREGFSPPPPLPLRPSSWMDALPEDVRKKLEDET